MQADLNGVAKSPVSTGNVSNDCRRNVFALPFGVLGVKAKRRRGRPPAPKENIEVKTVQNKTNGSVEKIKEIGILACPQCQQEFDGVNCSPIQEACGHIKCRACFILSLSKGANYCHQCELHKNATFKLENKTLQIETHDCEKGPMPASVSDNDTLQIKPQKKRQNQMKVKTLKIFPLPPPSHPPAPITLPASIPVSEKTSQSKLVLLDRVQSSNTNTEILGKDTKRKLNSDSDTSVKLLESGNESPVKKDPQIRLQIKTKDYRGNVPKGKIKSSNSKKNRKRNRFEIPDHVTIIQETPEDLVMYNCTHCSKKFKTRAHVKYHEFCGENALEKPYKCDECGNCYIAKSHYEYHLRTHTGEKPFVCPKCGKDFNQQGMLSRHMRAHHVPTYHAFLQSRESERPYVCPKCGKGFNQRGKVNRHMRSHTGERPFICQQCGRGFANTQALRSHFLIHTGERPFACQYCSKRFTGMTNLKKHVITHTGERPYSCTTCGKSFGLKWTLDLHVRTHSTDRPFACNQCTRAFTTSKDLRRHLVIHTAERPWKCGICGTAFRRKDNLERHIRSLHNYSSPKHVMSQIIHTNEEDTGEETTQKRNAEKTTPVTNQPELIPRVSHEDTSTALVEDNEEEILPHFENFESNEKLNLVPTSKCNESKDNIDEANNAYIKEKAVSFKALGSCQTKMEVIEAETTVEDLVREGLRPCSSNKNRLSPIVTAEDDLIQGIFIKQEQEPVHRNAEMTSYVPSQGVTVVHEEDGSTHILL